MGARIIYPHKDYINAERSAVSVVDTGQTGTGVDTLTDTINTPGIKPRYADLSGPGWDLAHDKLWIGQTASAKPGWISSAVSDNDCVISDTSIVINFSDIIVRPEKQSQITVNFGKDYATDFAVRIKAANGIEKTYTVTENASSSYILSLSESVYISSISITFTKTHLPESFVYIDSILVGEYTEYEHIKNLEVTQEIDILSKDLSMNECSVEIYSDTNTELPLGKYSPIDVVDSKGAYRGRYYIDKTNTLDNMAFDVVAYSAVYLLDKPAADFFYGCGIDDIDSIGLSSLIYSIFGLQNAEYTVPDIYINAASKSMRKREILQMSCQASGLYINTANARVLAIKQATADFIDPIVCGRITSSQILGKVSVTEIDTQYSSVQSTHNVYGEDESAVEYTNLSTKPGETVVIKTDYPVAKSDILPKSAASGTVPWTNNTVVGDYKLSITDTRNPHDTSTAYLGGMLKVYFYRINNEITETTELEQYDDNAEPLVIDDGDYYCESQHADVLDLRSRYSRVTHEVEADIILGDVNIGQLWEIETYIGAVYKVLITSLIIDGSGTPTAHMKGLVW